MIDDDILEQAAEWLVRLDEADCRDDERQAFVQWCAADPRHAAAVEQMRLVIGQFAGLHGTPQAAEDALDSALRMPRQRIPRSAAAVSYTHLTLPTILLV